MPEQSIRDTSNWTDTAYQLHILQGVSRSFALTIPQLPEALAAVVGNGYLLCRIADTIEDSSELSFAQKRDFAGILVDALGGSVPPARFARTLLPLLDDRTPASERDLISNTERVIRVTRSFTPRQQMALTRCVTIMLEGMAHFQQTCHGDGLADLDALNSYCYHVAGVVGEMLSELFCDYSQVLRDQEQTVMGLAVSFGQGLQMTNILKDVWDDRARGACWLPQTLMRKHGIDPAALEAARGTPQFAALLDELIAIAHAHLRNALHYTLLIPASEAGLRRFCLWSIGLALMTLRTLHRHPGFSSGDEIKISRRTLRATLLLGRVAVHSDTGMRLLFAVAARGLPLAPPISLRGSQLRVDYRLPASRASEPAQQPKRPPTSWGAANGEASQAVANFH